MAATFIQLGISGAELIANLLVSDLDPRSSAIDLRMSVRGATLTQRNLTIIPEATTSNRGIS